MTNIERAWQAVYEMLMEFNARRSRQKALGNRVDTPYEIDIDTTEDHPPDCLCDRCAEEV